MRTSAPVATMVPQRRRSQDWGALAILCDSPNCATRASGVGKQTIRRGRHEFRAKKTERITQQERALEPVGSVPERARLGHRARRLQRDGAAWEYLPHDHARSKAYRWNEDGIAGICDRHQHICFALALWNGRDPILKERLFGLTGNEGNHGEDVKEYYFYLDSTPTHSYMKFLYKYPQAEFPYARLVEENRRRSKAGSRI